MLGNMNVDRKWEGEGERKRFIPVFFYFLFDVIGEIIWQMLRRKMED